MTVNARPTNQIVIDNEPILISESFDARNKKIIAAAGKPTAFGIGANKICSSVLRAQVDPGQHFIEIVDAASIRPGQLLKLSANSSVDTGYNYKKIAIAQVSAVRNKTITLNRTLDFHFGIKETKVDFYNPVSAKFENVEFVILPGKRVDFRRLTSVILRNCTIYAQENLSSDGLFIAESCNVWIENLKIIGGRYPLQITQGTYNTRISNLHAENCWHPVDASVWARDVEIENASAVNVKQLIQCHPCFNVWFRKCADVNENDPLLRCIGGGLEDCKLTKTSDGPKSISGAWLHPEYNYLSDRFERTYRRVHTNGFLTSSNCRKMIIEDCTARGVYVDGYSFRVPEVEWRGVNKVAETRIRRSKITSRRVPVVAASGNGGMLKFDRRSLPDVGQPWEFSFKQQTDGKLFFCLMLVDIWEQPIKRFRIEAKMDWETKVAFVSHNTTKPYSAEVIYGGDWIAVSATEEDGRAALVCECDTKLGTRINILEK